MFVHEGHQGSLGIFGHRFSGRSKPLVGAVLLVVHGTIGSKMPLLATSTALQGSLGSLLWLCRLHWRLVVLVHAGFATLWFALPFLPLGDPPQELLEGEEVPGCKLES